MSQKVKIESIDFGGDATANSKGLQRMALSRARRQSVDDLLRGYDDKPWKNVVRHSQYLRLIEDTSIFAEKYALENGIEPDDFDFEILMSAIEPIDSLRRALSPSWPDDDATDRDIYKHFNFWPHEHDPLNLIRAGIPPRVDRDEVESAIGEYLKGEIRTDALDILFLDIAIGMELYAASDEMMNTGQQFGFVPLKKYPIFWPWVTSVTIETIIYGVLVTLVVICASFGWISSIWAALISIALIGIYLVFLARTIIRLPAAFGIRKKVADFCSSLVDALTATYRVLDGKGPVSVAHLRKEIEKATSAGAGWPPSLYALLEDIEKRTTRLDRSKL